MKPFFKLFSISLQGQLYYRTSLLLNLLTPIVNLVGQFLLWSALYQQQGGASIGGMSQQQMGTYILIAFALNNLMSWSTENLLSKEIKTGTVVSRWIRPVSFLTQYVAEVMGMLALQAVVNLAIVLLCFLGNAGNLVLPEAKHILLFLPCVLLAVILRILLTDTFSLCCFFTTGHLGITWTRIALFEFFSGALVPVSLFPVALRTITYLTPFPYMLQIPISVLMGQELPVPIGLVFALQLVWILLLYGLHRVLFRYIRNHMSIAGG